MHRINKDYDYRYMYNTIKSVGVFERTPSNDIENEKKNLSLGENHAPEVKHKRIRRGKGEGERELTQSN